MPQPARQPQQHQGGCTSSITSPEGLCKRDAPHCPPLLLLEEAAATAAMVVVDCLLGQLAVPETGDLDVLGGLGAQVSVRGLDALEYAGDLAGGGVNLGHGKDGRAAERLGGLDVLLQQLLSVGARGQRHGVVIAGRVGSLHQDALFLTRDSTWSAMRNTVVPLYQPARLARLIPVMQSYVDALVANIAGCSDQDFIPFCQLSLRMAIDIIGKTAFGIEFGLSKNAADGGGVETDGGEGENGDDDVREFLKEYKRSMEFMKMDLSSSLSTILGLFLPCIQTPCKRLLRRVPGTADYKMDENERRLCRRLDAIIAGRRRDRAARLGDGAAPSSAPLDFIAALLDAMESGGGAKELALEDRHVRALAYEHLIAGTKTTAFTLSSVVYLVSCHLRVEEKLLREVDAFAPPHGRAPNADELQSRFPYLDKVIKEAMRFHLVSPLIARQTSERVEIAGYVLPKGTYVWLAPGVLARDAAQFPEPEEFRPERFEADGEEERARHPYAHIPFGVGPRACIGHKFALQQVKLAVVELYRRYVFRHSAAMESPVEFDFDLVLAFRHGVKLRAIRREGETDLGHV